MNAGPPPPKRDDFSSRGGRGGPSLQNANKVHVSNLSWSVDDASLKTLFSELGDVLEAKVIYDRDSGRSRGFGFVTYSSADEVNNAIESLDGVVSCFVTYSSLRLKAEFIVLLVTCCAFECGVKWHSCN